jgi:hypothetical protein
MDLKKDLQKHMEALEILEMLSVSPPPLLDQKYHWIFYLGIENWKKEAYKRIKKILWRDK